MDIHISGQSLPSHPTTHRPGASQCPRDQRLRAWADAAAGGDAEAFAKLYGACRSWVLASCRTRLPAHDAEDVCAEVFARAWRHLHTGRKIQHPLAWLATVTRNLIADHHRRSGRTIPSGDLAEDGIRDVPRDEAASARAQACDPSPGPAELAAVADIAPMVNAWLAGLSPQAKAAIIGHMSHEDKTVTCTRLGCSVSALHASLYRSRRRLRMALRSHGVSCPGPTR
ncbi:MAG: RNA polymerase sigma factor [Stackebrandtia sp.]